MHLITSVCFVVLLLSKTHNAESRPDANADSGRQAITGHPPIESTTLYQEEATLINAKWADFEKIRFYEFQTISRRCKRYLLQHKPTIAYTKWVTLDRLNDRNQCRTALDVRKIVVEALEAWTYDLNAIVGHLRNSMLLISDVFITYFKLMVSRCQIYFPPGAIKFKDLFEEVIRDEKLLDINAEKSNPDARLLNNVVRYLSGVFNPAMEFQKVLEEVDKEAAGFEDGRFEEYLADAVEQIQTIGKMLGEIVDSVEDAAYQGLKIYSEGMRIFKTHKAIFTNSIFRDKRKSVAEIDEFNKQIRLGIHLVKNIKSVDIMFGQSTLKGIIGNTGMIADGNMEEDDDD